MEQWQLCCKNQQLVVSYEEPMAEGKKRRFYKCENCRAVHFETLDADGTCLKRNTKNIDPSNL